MAANGHAAAPPTKATKSRRLIPPRPNRSGMVATFTGAGRGQPGLSAHRHQQWRLIHALLLLRVAGPQWRINAVQVGRVDLHVAVRILRGWNLPGFDGAQDGIFVAADGRSGCCKVVHGVPTIRSQWSIDWDRVC